MSRLFIITFLSLIIAGSISAQRDSIPESIIESNKNAKEVIIISDAGLESELKFGAIDSQIYDHKFSTVHLYGNAYVKYLDKELYADYIILQMGKNIAEAKISPVKKSITRPKFKDGDKVFEYNRLKYNFETEKGIVIDAVTQEGEFYIHGARTKYVNEENTKSKIIYNANSLITTCQDHEHPHFGIRAKKMKIISEKLAVFGPSNLELGGVPTPIIIPFGFYPLTQANTSGFIFPRNYEFNSRSLGFGLLGFGWYFPINDYVHTQVTADLYTRGTWGLYSNTTYKKKYKYQGSIRLSFNDRRTDGVKTTIDVNGEPVSQATVISQKGYSIRVDHKQDSKAHPFVNVGGTINVVGNNNQQRNYNDAGSVLTNTYSSNFYYRHSMPGTPFSFNMGLNHNQNTRTRTVNITFPDVQLNMNTIYPFERKNRGSNKEMWYEKISFDYDVKLKSFVQATDTTLFTREMYDDIKTGMTHRVTTGFSTRVLKHFNLVPRAQYDETWVLNSIEKSIALSEFSQEDTLVTNVVNGFDSYRTYSAGLSLNTQIFGTMEFNKGWLRGIRHTMKPEIGYNYAPDTRSIYRDTVYYADDERLPAIFTRFDNGPFNTPSFTDLQSQLQFRINNIFEIKHFAKRDSTIKKAKIFDNLTLSGNYNFAKDTISWSRIEVNSTSRFFKGITTVITRWSFDPYVEKDDRPVNTFVWTESKKPVRLESGQIRLSNRLTFKKIKEVFSKKSTSETSSSVNTSLNSSQSRNAGLPETTKPEKKENESIKEVSLIDLLDRISIDHNILYVFTSDDGVINSRMQTHALGVTGSIPLTDNWTINIGNLGYDFVNKGLTYPAVSFSRKLHCWDMNFSWYPNRDTYTFSIGVRSNALSFLKYNYGQNNVDGLIGRL